MAPRNKRRSAPGSADFRLTVRFGKDDLSWAAEYARDNDRDVSWVVRRALGEYRQKYDPDGPVEAARKGGAV